MNHLKKRKRPHLAKLVFHGKLLRSFRERAQLSLTQVAAATGIALSSLSDYECGKIVPQLHQLKKLCDLYELDSLEVCELIHLKTIETHYLRDFRKACAVKATTPRQTMRDFIILYSDITSENKK